MAYALVGSVGTVATGTTSASPTFAQATTAGNLLVCLAYSTGSAVSVSGTGWVQAAGAGFVGIAYRPNCGASEAAPSVTGTTVTAAVLLEFSGGHRTSPEDQVASGGGVTSPRTITTGGVDASSGELWVSAAYYTYSMSATKTTSHASNNATMNNAGNNDATSTANHYRFAYGFTTSNAAADNLTDTFTTTNISGSNDQAVSFKLAPPPASLVVGSRLARNQLLRT